MDVEGDTGRERRRRECAPKVFGLVEEIRSTMQEPREVGST